jgi:hypothetical protein
MYQLVTAANMINKAGAGGAAGATKTATFYTVSSTYVPANNLRLRLGRLDITMDDNTTEVLPIVLFLIATPHLHQFYQADTTLMLS